MDQTTQERTALVIAREVWGWGGWALGVTLAAAARQLLVQSGGDEMVEGVFQAVGAALLAAGCCVIAIWLVYACRKRSPAQQLKLLGDDLVRASNDLRRWREMDEVKVEETSSVRTIIRKLDKLRIPHPPMRELGSVWYAYIRRIIGEANAGAIDEARLVWREMQEEQGAR